MFQVSDQCMGLVRDSCLIPTYDAPELGYIKESSNEQYVPDVFYKVSIVYFTSCIPHCLDGLLMDAQRSKDFLQRFISLVINYKHGLSNQIVKYFVTFYYSCKMKNMPGFDGFSLSSQW